MTRLIEPLRCMPDDTPWRALSIALAAAVAVRLAVSPGPRART